MLFEKTCFVLNRFALVSKICSCEFVCVFLGVRVQRYKIGVAICLNLLGMFYGSYDSKGTPPTSLSSMAGNAIPVPLCSAINMSMTAEFGAYL